MRKRLREQERWATLVNYYYSGLSKFLRLVHTYQYHTIYDMYVCTL